MLVNLKSVLEKAQKEKYAVYRHCKRKRCNAFDPHRFHKEYSSKKETAK